MQDIPLQTDVNVLFQLAPWHAKTRVILAEKVCLSDDLDPSLGASGHREGDPTHEGPVVASHWYLCDTDPEQESQVSLSG
jgi:hypothetical protein